MIRLRVMNSADVEDILSIEQEVHAHPWTHGNFVDALNSNSPCYVYENEHEMLGYAVLLFALDDVELLNISIAAAYQRKGLGSKLLGEVVKIAHRMKMCRILLEVRPSNMVALGLYHNSGFKQVGLRRAYYPAAENGREDAIVMERIL